ncbi:MAG: hypothetical protein LBR53_04400 [Deltaproteobacteria bacterium]|nr:hypothetical protein [Deltaproteobacteria bacterium]
MLKNTRVFGHFPKKNLKSGLKKGTDPPSLHWKRFREGLISSAPRLEALKLQFAPRSPTPDFLKSPAFNFPFWLALL